MFTRVHPWFILPLIAVMTGCQSPMRTPIAALSRGDYGAARMQVRKHVVNDPSNRRYLLDRMRLGVLTLADGYPQSAQHVFEKVYEVLRSQGINRDKTVQSIVLNEDVKIWKGEPFEQALALAYYAMDQAELGSWDNARAAAQNALFYLRDFGKDKHGQPLDTQAIAHRSLLYERAVASGMAPDEALRMVDAPGAATADLHGKGEGGYLNHGYVAVPSNFTLGYLLNGISNQQLARDDEASDNFAQAVKIDPTLKPLVEALRAETYNTVLVVSWGLGPEKIGVGPDRAVVRFAPRFPSDQARLYVSVNGTPGRRYTQVLDVNHMAQDHLWNNLANIRQAKSAIGSVLMFGGLLATGIGANNNSDTAVYAGLGAAAAGLFLKAGAHVDVRYADVMPQRIYLVPLNLDTPSTITLQVDGRPASKLVLPAVPPPSGPEAQLRYVRLISPSSGTNIAPPAWAVSGRVLYANPYTTNSTLKGAEPNEKMQLPYILGGRDARPPTAQTLTDNQQAGYLTGYTLAQLRELYRLEGVKLTVEDQGGYAGLHLLEGGDSLVSPLPGTEGFVRLFCQVHPHYQPKTAQVRQAAQRQKDKPDEQVNQASRGWGYVFVPQQHSLGHAEP